MAYTGFGEKPVNGLYAGKIIKHPVMENPTIVVITDRNDLDDQLFGTFAGNKDLLRQNLCRPIVGHTCVNYFLWLQAALYLPRFRNFS